MHYLLMFSESWIRRKGLETGKLWNSNKNCKNNHFWVVDPLVYSHIGLRQNEPPSYSPNVSLIVILNLVITHQPWLQKMLGEPGKSAKKDDFPAGIYLLKVNNKNTRKKCEICSKLTIKTPERRIGVVLVSLLVTLNIFHCLY